MLHPEVFCPVLFRGLLALIGHHCKTHNSPRGKAVLTPKQSSLNKYLLTLDPGQGRAAQALCQVCGLSESLVSQNC